MNRLIDHDEEGREESEYEELDEEEEEEHYEDNIDEDMEEDGEIIFERTIEELVDLPGPSGISEGVKQEEIYIDEEIPTTSDNQLIEIAYEEVYNEPIQLAETVPHQIIKTEKVYYENEMEHLVYDEIFGESEQNRPRIEHKVQQHSQPMCMVCTRTESEKVRLFRWPKSPSLRELWLAFFRIPETAYETVNDQFICSFHFTADTFVVVDDRIYWKAAAQPKYRQRRPAMTEPFPWESSYKQKMDEVTTSRQQHNNSSQNHQTVYRIRYRRPVYAYKNRNQHAVVVISPVEKPHLYYEFHFNRYGKIDTKFYACLGCRKAKTESGIRDGIRTIHLRENRLLSPLDPFSGHHFACRPHNVYDFRSSWRTMNHGETHQQFNGELVYCDESGNTIPWEILGRHDDIDVDMVDGGRKRVHEEVDQVVDQEIGEEIAIYREEDIGEPIIEEVVEIQECPDSPPILEQQYPTVDQSQPPPKLAKKSTPKRMNIKQKCHLCMKRDFKSTSDYVEHLQNHIDSENECDKCGKRISCDSAPLLKRRKICETCW